MSIAVAATYEDLEMPTRAAIFPRRAREFQVT